MKQYFRIDFSKNTKLLYYLEHLIILFTPKFFFLLTKEKILKKSRQDQYIQYRVNYYNKTDYFSVKKHAKNYKQFFKEPKKTYFFDLLTLLKYFPSHLRFHYIFGDVIDVPDVPSFVKSRPINVNNQNSVLLKLNKIRHFIFVKDKNTFESKKNLLVWRGKCYKEHRQKFIQKFYNHPLCNVGQTNTKGDINVPWQKEKLSLQEQLKYKFILAIEGNDVASNLKWIMSSSSLVFMTQPKYETWFMEGTLKANYHYVLLKEDYSDLEEKILYYTYHVEEAKKIISQANLYTEQFRNIKQEKVISLLVMEKYFQNAGELS